MRTGVHFSSSRTAFTLVELLVVIGIIAVLIGILLPVLNGARRRAVAIACMSNLRQVGIGMQFYVAEYKGYFPGPNTSGLALRFGNPYAGDPNSPVQDWDWASPSVGKMLSFPRQSPGQAAETARLLKFRLIMESKLNCGANEYRYGTRYSGSALPGNDNPVLMSYCTPTFFHILSSATHTDTRLALEDAGSTGFVRIPPTYVPKITHVGPAAQKIFAFEGARYWDPTKNWFDYSTDPISAGLSGRPQGAFHTRGLLAAPGSSGEPYSFLTSNLARPSTNLPATQFKLASLRHNNKMNVVFFDGHCEAMDFWPACRTELWAPKGSKVQSSVMYNVLVGNTTTYPFNSILP